MRKIRTWIQNLQIKPISYILQLILGLSIVIYILYIRVLLIRIPKSLYIIEPFNYSLIFVISIWILISIYIIIKSVKILYNYPEKKTSILVRLKNKVIEVIDTALGESYIFITNYITQEKGYETTSLLAKNFYSFFGQKPETIFLFISYAVRFIIIIAFIYDVFFLFELKYFYKSLFLLIIPLIINLIFYILRDFSTNLEEARSYLIIQETGFDSQTKEPMYTFRRTPEHPNIDLNYHVQEFIICSKIKGYLAVYDSLNTYYAPRVNIILYSLYLSGWLYILIINLPTFNILELIWWLHEILKDIEEPFSGSLLNDYFEEEIYLLKDNDTKND